MAAGVGYAKTLTQESYYLGIFLQGPLVLSRLLYISGYTLFVLSMLFLLFLLLLLLLLFLLLFLLLPLLLFLLLYLLLFLFWFIPLSIFTGS